jgi:glycosyltransferase involved in cell wall biosynthesis
VNITPTPNPAPRQTPRQTKVLLVSPLPPPAGGRATWTQRFLHSTFPPQIKLRHINSSVGDYSQLRTPLVRKLFTALSLLPRLIWIIATWRPDVVHFTSSGGPGILRDSLYIVVARALGRRVIVHLHFGDPKRIRQSSKILRFVTQATFRMCAVVVPLTEEIAAELKALGCERVQVVPNLVEIRDPEPSKPRAEDAQVKVIFVGWVIPQKGVEELITAIGRVPRTTLTLVGPLLPDYGGGDDRWLAGLIERSGAGDRIAVRGEVPHELVRSLYHEHDILALPSHTEGFPNAIIEAMESGLPIVATRVGAIPEIVREGVDGFLMDVGDVDELASKLSWLVENADARGEMGQAGRSRAIERFSPEHIVTLWSDIYARAHRSH